jgi:hypothetical protein
MSIVSVKRVSDMFPRSVVATHRGSCVNGSEVSPLAMAGFYVFR